MRWREHISPHCRWLSLELPIPVERGHVSRTLSKKEGRDWENPGNLARSLTAEELLEARTSVVLVSKELSPTTG